MTSGNWTWGAVRFGGGDADPGAATRFGMEPADHRLLWPYTTSREVYRCASDRGMDASPWMQRFDNLYATVGSSYLYTPNPWCDHLLRAKDPVFGIMGKKEDWVSCPARRIIFNEPPAEPYWQGDGVWRYFFWHYARGPATVHDPYSRNATDRSISPVLFADQHAAKHDFTRAIRSSPNYPCEAQPLWYWYEAGR